MKFYYTLGFHADRVNKMPKVKSILFFFTTQWMQQQQQQEQHLNEKKFYLKSP